MRRGACAYSEAPYNGTPPIALTPLPPSLRSFYAHRLLPSVLVMEVEVLVADGDGGSGGGTPAADPPLPLAVLRLTNRPGPPSGDINFTAVPTGAGAPYTIVNGSTRVAETNTSGLQAVAVLVSAWPARDMLVVPAAGVSVAFMAVIRTSVETPPGLLVAAVEADWEVAQVRSCGAGLPLKSGRRSVRAGGTRGALAGASCGHPTADIERGRRYRSGWRRVSSLPQAQHRSTVPHRDSAQVLLANGTLHSSHVVEWAHFAWGAGVEVGPGRRDIAAASNGERGVSCVGLRRRGRSLSRVLVSAGRRPPHARGNAEPLYDRAHSCGAREN